MDLTDEQKAEIKERRQGFAKDMEALIEKWQIEPVSGPTMVPVGPGIFAISMMSDLRDTKYLPTPSPVDPTKPL